MTRRLLPPAAVAAGSVLIVASLAVQVVNTAQGVVTADTITDLALLPVAVCLGVFGPLIARRQPENSIGLLMSVVLFLAGVIMLADAYAATAVDPGSPSRPHEELAVWATAFIWVPIVLSLLVLVPILFPTGAPLTPRWRRVEQLVWCQIAVTTPAFAFASGPIEGYPVDNPVTPPPHALWTAFSFVGFLTFPLSVAVGATAIVVRYRRARGTERQQLRWLVFGAGIAVAALLLAILTGSIWKNSFNVAIPVGLTSVVLATGIAILRYRLYDIDRLISRTVSYGVLTVVLGAAYAGLVLAGQALFSAFAGGSHLAVAASTLIVAAVFLPLRGQVQRFVDRRFNRRRYDTGRTLESFGSRLQQEIDLRTLRRELERVVDETMQPSHVSLWVRRGTR